MNCLAQISQVLVGLRLVLGGRHVEVQPELPKQDLLTVRPILDTSLLHHDNSIDQRRIQANILPVLLRCCL